jgi:hypothetical protein
MLFSLLIEWRLRDAAVDDEDVWGRQGTPSIRTTFVQQVSIQPPATAARTIAFAVPLVAMTDGSFERTEHTMADDNHDRRRLRYRGKVTRRRVIGYGAGGRVMPPCWCWRPGRRPWRAV